jgi:hypothetical protein
MYIRYKGGIIETCANVFCLYILGTQCVTAVKNYILPTFITVGVYKLRVYYMC